VTRSPFSAHPFLLFISCFIFRNCRVRRTRQILSARNWALVERVLRMFPYLRRRASLAGKKKHSRATRLDSQKKTKTGFGKFDPYWRKSINESFTFLASKTHDLTFLLSSIGRFRIPRIVFGLAFKPLVRMVAIYPPKRLVMFW
jgi:hypothetical protein